MRNESLINNYDEESVYYAKRLNYDDRESENNDHDNDDEKVLEKGNFFDFFVN